MRKSLLLGALLVAGLAAAAWYYQTGRASAPAAGGAAAPAPGAARGARGTRAGLTVGTATTTRQTVSDSVTVVGSLIGEATVDVTPRVGGRIEAVLVRLGDRVTRGQLLARMDARDITEQVRQAQASLAVNKANVTARENDLRVARNNLTRADTQFAAGLVSKQTFEDAESRFHSAQAQVDVARAQVAQTEARIDELNITLSNTNIVSPVDGFVGRRSLDPGAFAGTNTVIVSVVAIGTVRLVANLVEKDLRRVTPGVEALVEVDAFPGEKFSGQVSRVAPVFDPATRTATMEIEVPNPRFRLKPGMYARVVLTTERRADALVVPRAAVVDIEGQRGVFVIDGQTAKFRVVRTGLQDGDRVEILDGLTDGEQVVTAGALAVRDGDRVTLAGENRGGRSAAGPASGRQ